MKIKTTQYDESFYKIVDETALNSANVVLPILLEVLPVINSAVDFGCGIGTWLSVLHKLGVGEIKGFDGLWVNQDALKIPQECFTAGELDKGVCVDKKYDLAISLEVAEHLPEASAELFIKSLTQASDIVLFSAAIPFQGGVNHINEQWPEYWNAIFNRNGYIAIDYLRKMIWDEKKVASWYRQNIMLYVKKEKADGIKVSEGNHCIKYPPMSLVLPEIYLGEKNNNCHLMPLFILYKVALIRTIATILGPRLTDMIIKAKGEISKMKVRRQKRRILRRSIIDATDAT
jgi:hypothetical protein